MEQKDFRPRATPLGLEEKISMSRMLQVFMLEEIARLIQPEIGDLAFHGGTSLSLTMGSPRWSEDLDFVATPETFEKARGLLSSAQRSLTLKASLERPGSTIEIQDKTRGAAEIGEMGRWQVRWTHPDRIGAVRIKVEFYLCPKEVIAAYGVRPAIASAPEARSRFALPCAVPLTVWADKIVALANRPAFKPRDVHDLGFILPILHRDAHSTEDRIAALEATMAIYGKGWADIRSGLERSIVVLGAQDSALFEEDMERWFFGQDFRLMKDSGVFQRLHSDFLINFEDGSRIVRDMSASPGVDGDF